MTSATRSPASAERSRNHSSFATDLKHELALQLPARSCCQLSELRGFVAAAPLAPAGGHLRIRLASNISARKAVRLAGLLEGARGELHGEGHYQRGPTHLRPSYLVSVAADAGSPLESLAAEPTAPVRSCCRRAFLRGAYLAGGSISVGPSGYHLELALAGPDGAAAIAAALAGAGLRSGQRRRGRRTLVYIKGSEDIATALKLMGAGHAVLNFENDRILREMRAGANRQANTETANLRRVVASSLRQVTAAARLASSGALESQPLAIREAASMRMAMPEASLQQVAARLGLSKSAVNARLRRLVMVAEEAGLLDLPWQAPNDAADQASTGVHSGL